MFHFFLGLAFKIIVFIVTNSTNCDAHLAESLFQTRSGKNSLRQ
ncbi:MAG: DUF6783 domain-containing protein [Lachnospiraceae bacterium]